MGEVVGEPATDADLVVASLDDPQEFGKLFDRHGLAVHRYVASRAGRADIDDLVSETFVTAFRARARYDRKYPNARPWLLGIATNVLRHHYRSEHRRLGRLGSVHRTPEVAVDLSESVAAAVDGASETDHIAEALDRLDDRYREVLLLVASTDLTYEEIVRALGVPIGTVRSRLARGRRRLRELLLSGGQYEMNAHNAIPAPKGLSND